MPHGASLVVRLYRLLVALEEHRKFRLGLGDQTCRLVTLGCTDAGKGLALLIQLADLEKLNHPGETPTPWAALSEETQHDDGGITLNQPAERRSSNASKPAIAADSCTAQAR